MTHELILTSVSQGLEQDSRGFCAVAEDEGIPRYLHKRLETLSGYEHLFTTDSDDYPLQPVVYSHLIFPGADTTWHVLSRIADTGLDFQSEPNRLAHHVALQENEFVPEGPAWLAALPGFHLTEWLTPSVRFTQGRPIPSLTAPPPLTRRQRIARERRWLDHGKMSPIVFRDGPDLESIRAAIKENEDQIAISRAPSSPCPGWETLTGDAGWAGTLAETIRTGQEAVLLFKPGQNLLPLFVEALALLPPSFLWRGTFSTWYTHLPEHVTCHWKGVLAGTLLSAQLQQDRDLLVIDLTRPMGTAPAGPYVEFARTGLDGTLPSDEEQTPLFLSPADSDTKPYSPDAAPVPTESSEEGTSGDVPVPEPMEKAPDTAAGASLIPPIVVGESPKVRARSKASSGAFGKLLNMKSRSQFYVLYGATFLLVLFLLVMVLDQVADFGLARWFRGSPETQSAVDPAPRKSDARKAPKAGDNLDPAVIREEKIRKQKELKERQAAARKNKRELLAKANELREDFVRHKENDKKALDDMLMETAIPRFLPMSVPPVNGDSVDPPAAKVYPELASLYRYGLALELKYLPLLEFPKIRVETKKLEFTRQLASEVHTSEEGEEPQSKLGETVDADMTSDQPDPELSVPDTERFEWSVMAVDTETERETPMFHLKLAREGLILDWRLEGMAPQHLYDTLAASLGFLRISVENENDMSKIRSIPMYVPVRQKPILVAERFSNPEKTRFSVPTPFSVQPWKSLFETTKIPYVLRLQANVAPENAAGIHNVEYPEQDVPSTFFVNFETEISSRKTVADDGGNYAYSPVDIVFEATVDPDQVLWTNRYNDQIELLKDELENSRPREKELDTEIDQVGQQIVAGSPSASELRKKRSELRSELSELKSRLKEIEDILAKIPSAYEKIVKSEQLRFEYSVFLEPVFEDPDADHGRLRSEESLLLMKAGE